MVSTPPPVPPGPRDPDDLEPDPTGIHALLSSLPDPGPMPPDLVDRITASIEAERAAGARSGHPHDGAVVPLRRRRIGWKPLAAAAAAAAVVAIGAPALLDGGPGGIVTSLSGGSGRDDAAASAEAGDSPALSDQAATSGSAPFGDRTPADAPSASADGQGGVAPANGSVTMVASGTAYTSAELATQASLTMRGSKRASAMDHAVRGPADGASGLRACLAALGAPSDGTVWADRGTVDGKPAVVAVVRTNGGTTVYAVEPGCDGQHPAALAGPVPLG